MYHHEEEGQETCETCGRDLVEVCEGCGELSENCSCGDCGICHERLDSCICE